MVVMVVDDSDTSRLVLETILKNCGYSDLIMAASARDALDFLQESVSGARGTPVDLILMDIVMPGMDGIEACRIIKSKEALRDIPIIMVTVKDEEDSLERAFEAGAIDFIGKPVSKTELRARVRSVLKLKEEMERRKARERELEALTQKLEMQSLMDGLTQVPNRRAFEKNYTREWRRSHREKQSLGVLMIDIDFFKNYNDTYGHLQGDTCLKEVALAIQNGLRRPGDFMARYGGEEFVVVLPNTEEPGAVHVAETIRTRVHDLAIAHASSLVSDHVTISIGLSYTHPEPSLDPNQLLSASDEALYQAKKSGRDQIRIKPLL